MIFYSMRERPIAGAGEVARSGEKRILAPFLPKRIVSLCPSLTETLFALGLADSVAGRTRYCVHPADDVRSVPVVGGTKDVDPATVDRCSPDLIIAVKEENMREAVELLGRSYPVFVFDVNSYDGALRAISDLGKLTGRQEQAQELHERIRQAFASLEPIEPRTAVYLVWDGPYLAAGGGTYIDSLLAMCGLRNVCADRSGYPTLTADDLRALNPEVVLLPDEPFEFDRSHADRIRELLPSARVPLVDGQLLSWYGSRMRLAPPYLMERVLKELR